MEASNEVRAAVAVAPAGIVDLFGKDTRAVCRNIDTYHAQRWFTLSDRLGA
jgi:hypothetical protein